MFQHRTTGMTQVVIQNNWSVVGPGGHYGVFQYQTGPGWLDAQTAVMLGPTGFQIPLPIFVIVALACVVVVSLGFCIRLLARRHETVAD
jgi:hypothetical protein